MIWDLGHLLKRSGQRIIIGMGVCGLSVLLLFPFSVSSEPRRVINPEPGVFLYAVPELVDPNFLHTVVLLVTYSEEGATGVIINRRSELKVGEAFPEIEEIQDETDSLFFGGPVSRDRIFFLVRESEEIDYSIKVFDDIYFSWNHLALSSRLKKPDSENSVKILFGYAGWRAGQLDREIARNDWVLSKASPEAIFSKDPESVWLEIFNIQNRIEVQWKNPSSILPRSSNPSSL